MSLHLITPFFLILTVFSIGVYVFSRNTKNIVNRIFLLYSIISTLIVFTEYEFIFSGNYGSATFWLKSHLSIWAVLYAIQLDFIVVFTNANYSKHRYKIIITYVISIGVCINSFLNDIFIDIEPFKLGYIRNPLKIDSSAELIFGVYMTALTLITTAIGIRYLGKHAKKSRDRIKASFVLGAILIPTWMPFVKNGILPLLDVSIFFPDFQFIFIGWILFAIAIWRYEMFDITPKSAADKIVSTMKEALMLVDDEGKIVIGNKSLYRLFGFNEKQIIGKYILDFFSLSPQIGENYRQKEIVNDICTFKAESGKELTLSVSVSFLKDKNKKNIGYIFILNDISELKEAEEKLEGQQQQMINMAHQAGMAEIAVNVMHNIGNILNSVNISSEHFFTILKKSKVSGFARANRLLLDNMHNLQYFLNQDEKGKLLPEYFSQVIYELGEDNKALKTEGLRLVEKIKQIGGAIELQQVQAKSGNYRESVHVVAIVNEALLILDDGLLTKSIIVSKEILIDDSYSINVSKSKLLNILLCIIKNASESVQQNEVDKRKIKIKLFSPEKGIIQIDISDNGIGIKDEDISRIFEFGYTNKEHHNGFGLYFCSTTINEIGGSITVKSKGENKGAVFSVLIPNVS